MCVSSDISMLQIGLIECSWLSCHRRHLDAKLCASRPVLRRKVRLHRISVTFGSCERFF